MKKPSAVKTAIALIPYGWAFHWDNTVPTALTDYKKHIVLCNRENFTDNQCAALIWHEMLHIYSGHYFPKYDLGLSKRLIAELYNWLFDAYNDRFIASHKLLNEFDLKAEMDYINDTFCIPKFKSHSYDIENLSEQFSLLYGMAYYLDQYFLDPHPDVMWSYDTFCSVIEFISSSSEYSRREAFEKKVLYYIKEDLKKWFKNHSPKSNKDDTQIKGSNDTQYGGNGQPDGQLDSVQSAGNGRGGNSYLDDHGDFTEEAIDFLQNALSSLDMPTSNEGYDGLDVDSFMTGSKFLNYVSNDMYSFTELEMYLARVGLSDLVKELRKEFIKVAVQSTADLRGLTHGKIDRRAICRSGYSVNLFTQPVTHKPNKDFKVTFIVDESGSMNSYSRTVNIGQVFAICDAFCSAMQSVNIQQSIINFGSGAYIVKRFEEAYRHCQRPNPSNAYGTNLASALQLATELICNDVSQCKHFVVIITDGAYDGREENVRSLVSKLNELASIKLLVIDNANVKMPNFIPRYELDSNNPSAFLSTIANLVQSFMEVK